MTTATTVTTEGTATPPKPGNPPTARTGAPELPGEPPAADPEADALEGEETPSRREARYRVALRAAEAERDQLREQLETLRRREVERLATAEHGLAKPAALWKLTEANASELLGDDGEIDANRVAELVNTAIATLGLAVKPPPSLPPSPNAGREMQGAPGGVGWGDVLSSRKR